jgi:hypothetical protein
VNQYAVWFELSVTHFGHSKWGTVLKLYVKKMPVIRMSLTYSVFSLWPSFNTICCYHAVSDAAGKNYFGSARERERERESELAVRVLVLHQWTRV